MADKKKAVSIAAKKAGRRKTWRVVGIIAAIVAVVALVVVSYFTSSTYYRSATAVEIGDHKVSVADFNYYYRTVYQNTYNNLESTYGEYASMLIDTSKPLSEQVYSETQTWEDYLTDVTLDNLTDIYAIYDDAVKNGYTISEDGKAEIDAMVDSLASSAKSANYRLNNYLTAVYGKGVNEKVFRDLMGIVTVASEYSQKVQDDFSYTAADAESFYAAHSDEIDSVTTYLYTISYAEAEDVEEADSAARTREEAQAIADAFLEAEHTPEGYEEYIKSILTEDESESFAGSDHRYQGLTRANIGNDALADWLFDENRQEGDFGWVEGDGEFYLLFFQSRSDNDYDLVNMRHILIKPASEEESETDEDPMVAARARLEDIFTDWMSDDGSEDAFAVLANVYSEDGDGTTGGLYEGVYRGQMVDPINEWLFDESRQAGDYEFIETTYGWHLVYFSGLGGNYKTQLIDEAIRDDAYNTWHDAATAGYEAKIVEPGFGLTR